MAATFKIVDVDELKKISGTSFLIYSGSGQRKTFSTGSMASGSVTLHVSLDGGSNSSTDAMRILNIKDASHKVTTPLSLKELNDVIIGLHTNAGYKKKIDTIVIDNLVTITDWIKTYVVGLPRYKKDQLSIDNATNEDDINMSSSKSMAMYNDIQILTKGLINQILELKADYNVILLAGEVDSVDSAGSPEVRPLINGPKSILPVTSLFDECYRTDFTEGDFDSEDHVATYFRISTYTNMMTGMKYFAKTRNIKNIDYLKENKMPARFDKIFEEIGYVLKKDRKETK